MLGIIYVDRIDENTKLRELKARNDEILLKYHQINKD
jgi:hypothetical protein